MKNKINKPQSLSLTFKDEFELSKLFINSYNKNKIEIDNNHYKFPICILGTKIFELNVSDINSITSNNIKHLNLEYFSINSIYPELLIVGVDDYNFKDISRFRDYSTSNKIGIEIMKISRASGTFNFLTLEKRDFITIFI